MKIFQTIQNDFLTVKVADEGAELQSIKDKSGKEYLWQGNAASWKDHAPVLFPFCGYLVNDRYTHNGKSYDMGVHGFAASQTFICENISNDSITYLLASSEETRSRYPFDFEFRVTYTLIKNSISVKFTVNNKTDGKMYFSVGSHEGIALDGDITEYNLIFDGEAPAHNTLVKERWIDDTIEPAPIKNGIMEFCDSEFKRIDTYVFRDTVSKKVSLFKKGEEHPLVTVEFPETPNLLIWKEPGARFICIEPWHGIDDYFEDTREFTEKQGLITLEKDGVFTNTHTITFGGNL